MIGTLLSGRFRLEDKIGSGGMSTVYLAFDETLERWVAIKLMHRDISADPDQLERFRREARAVARLSHPHVVGVIDAGEDDGTPYIVFEYVQGETLKDRIRHAGPLPAAEAVAYAIEVGRALEAAHAERLVHRDVKPQNVLINLDGRAKVTDFGIARSLEAEGLTVTGRVLGTTDYVSPEQALGEQVTEQSDIYSLGICLYEMLTGAVPFKADTQVAVAMKHVREPMPDVQRRRPDISAALAAVVERATAKERPNRYATIGEMDEDLEASLAIEAARSGGTSGEATTVLRSLSGKRAGLAPGRLRRPRRAFVVTILAALLAAGLVAFFATRTERGAGGDVTPRGGGLEKVDLASSAVSDFDPQGDGRESPEATQNAIDSNPSTLWDTETYSGGLDGVDKQGVGLYVDAGSPISARQLDVVSPSPGFTAEVYATNEVSESLADWTRVAGGREIGETAQIDLDTAGQDFRYYLLWIVELPPGSKAAISELSLRR